MTGFIRFACVCVCARARQRCLRTKIYVLYNKVPFHHDSMFQSDNCTLFFRMKKVSWSNLGRQQFGEWTASVMYVIVSGVTYRVIFQDIFALATIDTVHVTGMVQQHCVCETDSAIEVTKRQKYLHCANISFHLTCFLKFFPRKVSDISFCRILLSWQNRPSVYFCKSLMQ